MVDIFLSYESGDRQRIQPVVAGLQAEGWALFWDPKIPAGQTWRQYIGRALEKARCIVVAWSKTSIQSEWVIEEADHGKRKGALIPLLLDEVDPPLGFRTIQAADLVGWSGDRESPAWQELVANIRELLGDQDPGALGQQRPTDAHVLGFKEQAKAATIEKERHVALPPRGPPVSTKRRLRTWLIGLSTAALLLMVSGFILWGIGLPPKTAEPGQAVSPPIIPRPDEQLVRQAQMLLQKLGYTVPIDGVLAPQTRDAIRDFQARNGLTVTGVVDNGLILDMVNQVKHDLRIQIEQYQKEVNDIQNGTQPSNEEQEKNKKQRIEELRKEIRESLEKMVKVPLGQ